MMEFAGAEDQIATITNPNEQGEGIHNGRIIDKISNMGESDFPPIRSASRASGTFHNKETFFLSSEIPFFVTPTFLLL